MGVVDAAGAVAGLPFVTSAALRFLKRRPRTPVAIARAVRIELPPALLTEVPGPHRAGLRKGVEAGGCDVRSSRRSARRHRSKSRPAPDGGAIRRRQPPAVEGGGAASRRPSTASLRPTGLSRLPLRARPATLATVAADVSREKPPAAGRDESSRAARARDRRRR